MRTIFIAFLLSFSFATQAQLAIGQWREHLPYNRGKMLADGGSKMYCATEDALFAYVKEDASIERFTRLTGLNDFGISTISYSTDYNVLVIGYANANIDLLYNDGTVFNISFIKEKNITGKKNINSIYIKNNLAYLACGFGIVVLDLSKQEIKDTYYIGASGASVNVFDITEDGSLLFAATDTGVYSASLSSANLSDYNNWNSILDDINSLGDYNHIISFGGKIYVNFAKPNAAATTTDELYMYDGSTWQPYINTALPPQPKRYNMRVIDNTLFVTTEYDFRVFDSTLQQLAVFDGNTYANPLMRDGWRESASTTWIADRKKGLIKITDSQITNIVPSGPSSAYVADIKVQEHTVWVAHGPMSTSWSPQDYPVDGFSWLKDGDWHSFNRDNMPSMGTNGFSSNMSIAIVPGESQHVRVGSVVYGLLDFKNDAITGYYDETNSTLIPAIGNTTQTKVHGIKHDSNGNLWVVNSGVPGVVHVLKPDGKWKTFNQQGAINGAPFAGYIEIDDNDYKWVNLFGGTGTTTQGLLVFDDSGTIDDESDDRKKYIPTTVYARCMAIDLDGQMWVGTDQGPQVIYSPASVFTDATTLQKILIKQENSYQYLLETEVVTYIAVDGANRKWIGTLSSGIYLLSADGQEEIHHFTTDNSPLLSNIITCIGIDNLSGEVYIGTDKGLISYQSDAVEGNEDCKDLLVYPNPVRPGYNGPIAIRGVIDNAKIKITDISGTVVYEGSALGGQAIWDGRNFKGEKSHTGVYLVFASADDGSNACVTKLLFVR